MTTNDDPTGGPLPESGGEPSAGPAGLVPASALRRLIAFLIDLVLIVSVQLAIGGGPWGFVGIFALYHTVSLAVLGRTVGKAVMALRVQRADGTRLRWLPAFLRSTVGYLASAFLLLGFLHVFRDPRRRTWHDVLFESEVVQEPGPLSVKQLVRTIDEWTEQVDVWLKRILARYNRIEKLFSLALKLTGLVGLLRGWVEQFVGWILGHMKGTAAVAAPQAATGTAGTAAGATATVAGTGALATVTSTITAVVLTGAAVITYQAVVPQPATGPYQGIAEDALDRKLNSPSDILVSSDGGMYIVDTGSHRIRRVGPDGILTTVAGSGPVGEHRGDFAGDGGKAFAARLNLPTGVAFASDGSLYIADTSNHRIRRVTSNGTITTVAGGGTDGIGDGGPATGAQLRYPYAVASGPDGSLYIADAGNHRIRRVGSDGVIRTVAGTGEKGFSGDGGPALEASLNWPDGIVVALDGSIFIADKGNFRIRRIGPDGIITTVAGGGTDELGDGGPATLARLDYVGPNVGFGMYRGPSPSTGLAIGIDGSLYIANTSNDRVRRVGPDGIITTVAGGGSNRPGDNGLATEARLMWPAGLAVGPDGNLYIADFSENRIRRVSGGMITTMWPGT